MAAPPASPPTRLWPRADYSLLDVERYFEERGARRLDYCSSRGRRDAPDWLGLRAERVVGEVVELAERYRVSELVLPGRGLLRRRRARRSDRERARRRGRAARAGAPKRAPRTCSRPRPAALQRLRASGCRGLQLLVAGVARERLLETAELLARAPGSAGVSCSTWARRTAPARLAAAVSAARALCAMDSRFVTPIRRRRVPAADARPGRSLEAWAALEKAPWTDKAC